MFTGNAQQVGNLNVEFLRNGRYVVLQVGRNPGIPIFIIASILLIGGLAITFYFPHRRIRGIISPNAKAGATAKFAPMARREWSGQRDFTRFFEGVREPLGIEPVIATSQAAEPTAEQSGRKVKRG